MGRAGARSSSLSEVLDALADRSEAEDGREIPIGDLLEELGSRSYGPLLLLPSLLALIPVIGAIPGMSVVTGSILVLVAVQLVVGRSAPWLPSRLVEMSLPRRQLATALRRSRRAARPMDRLLEEGRHPGLLRGPMLRVVGVALVMLGLLFYPTALIPWGVTAPALAATLLALGITVRDGLLVLVGLLVAGASALVLVAFWPL
jgi:hypothetical protein